jgi:parallel beta-helix repeat protein
MKSNRNIKFILLLGFFFAFYPIIPTNAIFMNSKFSDAIYVYNENLKTSTLSGKIHIDNNWTAAKATGTCTGNGLYSDPYIIKDLVIDADNSESCILIENSEAFFKLINCNVFNSYFGIRLKYTKNGWILNNNCSSNKLAGISLYHSSNLTISGNIVHNNDYWGISLFSSDRNNISENSEKNNDQYGIGLFDSNYNLILKNIVNTGINLDGVNNNISANLMNKCGLEISGDTVNFYSQYIDTTNLINGKPLYYYTNEINLGPTNFTNAGQIILASCRNSIVESLNLSYTDTGITLINCQDNLIMENIMNNNRQNGIYIFGGDNNTISENSVSYNNQNGIFLEFSSKDSFIENNVSYNNYNGYYCFRLENSIISGNNINYNNDYGIYLLVCKNNTIKRNLLIENKKCVKEEYSEGNVFENNECRDRTTSIPGYNLLVLLEILPVIAISIGKKIKRIN